MLVSHRPSPPGLDTRADSPMREKNHLAGNSSVNRNVIHGLPTPATDVPSSGFTAVNGGSTSARPDDSARETGVQHSFSGPTSSTYTSHGWRPEERRDAERAAPADQNGSPSSKRKRGEGNAEEVREGGRNDPSSAIGERSPKRPMTVLNSGGIHSPDRANQTRPYSLERDGDDLEQPSTGTYVREPTPTGRTGRTSPPPQARPETVSGLAASLNATLREEQQAQAAAQSNNPPNDGDQSVHFMPPLGDPNDSDPKRRKRNFSNRTKTGCHTCRSRKKKCDEAKPVCANCSKGGFQCGGYGPKPPGSTSKLGAVRPVVPLQAKQQYEQAQGSAPPFYDPAHPNHNATRPPPPPHWPDAHRPDPYGSVPYRYGNQQPVDHRPPSARDGWGPRPSWGPHDQPQPYPTERLPPPADFAGIPPAHHYAHDRPAHPPPLPGPWTHPQSQPQYQRPTLPPPPPPPVAPTVISSHESISTSHSGSHARSSLGFPLNGPLTEKRKMLAGLPYKHFYDDELLADRQSCRRAVERYNTICGPYSTASETEKGAHFVAVYNPRERPSSNTTAPWLGPVGACDFRTVVDAPFHCEFGYNINLGEHVVIGANCFMQDAGTIYIGDRTIVGPNVKFYCMTASVDASLRNEGCRGTFTAGAIKVEEDCFIGGDVTILPFRTIGKGAVVGAGSVVTRDVKPYTVVAGNPAKLVRKRKIETGAPDVDRHDDAIQEENDRMVELMKADGIVPQSLRDKMRDTMRQ